MRDIRARIGQRHGVELSNQQIQELAARRLESILDLRTINPSLLEQLRRGAGQRGERAAPDAAAELSYTFEDSTLYESHRGLLRFVRRLLNPLLKLFFNPNPLVRALNIQARLNTEAARRDRDRDERQAEWNALQYEILQRVVTEVSRVSLELQALATRIESLSAKVDFCDRRVRSVEAGGQQTRRPAEPAAPAAPIAPEAPTEAAADVQPAEGRRRRRRRRGRRGTPGAGEATTAPAAMQDAEALEGDAGEQEEPASAGEQAETAGSETAPRGAGDREPEPAVPVTTEGEAIVLAEEPQEAPGPPETARLPEQEPAGPAETPEPTVPESGTMEP